MTGGVLSAAGFIACALENPVNAALLARLRVLDLPQCHLAAGCLYQSVWNRHNGRAADWGVRDYDVFYFDDSDLSWEAEDDAIRHVAAACADFGVAIEVRNQAGVHLWYAQRFGGAYPQLTSARDGIDRYLVACTCIGIEVATGVLYATHGLQELMDGVLRLNPLTPSPDLFRAKAESYRARWPWLRIVND